MSPSKVMTRKGCDTVITGTVGWLLGSELGAIVGDAVGVWVGIPEGKSLGLVETVG
jgi:hypothetical protein